MPRACTSEYLTLTDLGNVGRDCAPHFVLLLCQRLRGERVLARVGLQRCFPAYASAMSSSASGIPHESHRRRRWSGGCS